MYSEKTLKVGLEWDVKVLTSGEKGYICVGIWNNNKIGVLKDKADEKVFD